MGPEHGEATEITLSHRLTPRHARMARRSRQDRCARVGHAARPTLTSVRVAKWCRQQGWHPRVVMEDDMQNARVSTVGLNRARVLAALYNNARVRGLRWFDPRAYVALTPAAAHQLLETTPDLRLARPMGHVMDVDLSDDSGFDPAGYDHHNGAGHAERVINHLRVTGSVERIQDPR